MYADEFQYVKMPDGSYGKFRQDASDDAIRKAIESSFPDAYKAASRPSPDLGQADERPFYRPEGAGAVAREAILGPVRALGMESTNPMDIVTAIPKGIGKAIMHPIETYKNITGEMERAGRAGAENVKAGKTGLGVSQMAASAIPMFGPQMADLFGRVEGSKGAATLPERVGMATEGAGIAAQAAPIGAPGRVSVLPRDVGKGAFASGMRKVAQIYQMVAPESAATEGATMRGAQATRLNRLMEVGDSAVEWDPRTKTYTKDPGTVIQNIDFVSKDFAELASKTVDAFQDVEKMRKSLIENAQKRSVRVSVESELSSLIGEAKRKAGVLPETAAPFTKALERLERDLSGHNLQSLDPAEAVEINQRMQKLADYDAQIPAEISNLTRRARHMTNEGLHRDIPGWIDTTNLEAGIFKGQEAAIRKMENLRRGRAEKGPTTAWKVAHTAAGAALGMYWHAKWQLLGAVVDKFSSVKSITGRAKLFTEISDILDPKGKFRPIAVDLTEPIPSRGAAPAARTLTAGPSQPSRPGSATAPSGGPAGATPSPGGTAAAPKRARTSSTSTPKSATEQVRQDTQKANKASYSSDLEAKMAQANKTAKYASTNEFGQMSEAGTGKALPLLPSGPAPVQRFAVHPLPGGGQLKATYLKIPNSETATLERIQIGKRVFKNPDKMRMALQNLGVDEQGLRAQLDQPAAPELHGTGEVGKKAAGAERKAEERAKAKREQPDEAKTFTPEDFLIAVDAGYEAITKQYGAKGKQIADALKTVAGQKKWTAEETYNKMREVIEMLDRQGGQ